jgi:hypothetical protein
VSNGLAGQSHQPGFGGRPLPLAGRNNAAVMFAPYDAIKEKNPSPRRRKNID